MPKRSARPQRAPITPPRPPAKPAAAVAAPTASSATETRLGAYATLPLRLFLGITFVYAGLQKIADPGFLHPGASTYIGTQLQAFSHQSPIGFLLEAFALPAPELSGVAVIAAELVIGAATILGIATRWAAAAGALLNFVLFLTASWTVQPYFLGSDSIYTVAWITLVLTGDQRVLALGPPLLRQLGFAGEVSRPAPVFDASRRRLLLQVGGATVAVVWALSVLPRTRRLPASSASPSPSPTAAGSAVPSASPSTAATPAGTKIGSIASLQARGSLTFTDAATGDPAVVVQVSNGQVVAFDAVCTHAGCTVAFDSTQKLLICPCHSAEFDPANAAAVVAGPAPTPLKAIKVHVSGGDVYPG